MQPVRDGLRSSAPGGKRAAALAGKHGTAEDAVLHVLVAGYSSISCENDKLVLARVCDSCHFSVLQKFYNSLNFTFTIAVAKLGETYCL